jgi:xanthine/uracil permease
MCVVMIVVMIESTGMFLALGEITGRPVTRAPVDSIITTIITTHIVATGTRWKCGQPK